MDKNMRRYQVTIELDAEDGHQAEMWAASVIDVARPLCPCTHNGKIEAFGHCAFCKGSGRCEHPLRPVVMSATQVPSR